ncbi:MAG: heavy metal translocating P-type ATPase [Spirochaetaceae bacterium]
MSDSKKMQKYRIEGLDCANCANEIETALRKLEGFDGATVSFSTSTISIPEERRETAEKTISRIEPEARIVDRSPTSATRSGSSRVDGAERAGGADEGRKDSGRIRRKGRHIGRILLALVMAVAGVIFQDVLQETPGGLGEYAVFLVAYVLVGWPVVSSAARNIVRGRVFDEMFLMTIATLGAIAIHELAEAVAVMLFYSVGEYVQDRAVGRSRRSISSLMDLRPDFARVVGDAGTREVDPESVEVGATIEVRPGERVPLDGEILRGESAVDTSALTGESVPRSIGEGDAVLSGFVNMSGTVRLRVTKAFSESSVSRILELVEDAAARKAPTEKFISRFAAVYTPIVVGIAAAIAFVPPLVVPGAALGDWVYRALVMLVISCPCALVISIPLGYFGGIGGASRNGILIKGSNYLDALTDLSVVVLDKTGTLTRGTFEVTRTEPRNGFDRKELLRLAALAESHSSHPIARSIRVAYERLDSGAYAPDASASSDAVSDVREEKGYGVMARVGSQRILAGNDRLLHREGIEHSDCNAEGTVVYVAVEGTYAGYIVIADEMKPDAAEAVAEIKRLGVDKVIMLTGDGETVARRVADDAGIDTVYAGLLPEEKVAKVEEIAAELPGGKRLAFVGDGINDAPVLMRADIGIAMGALGSDAAIEAADIVLMDDQMGGVGSAVRVARHTRSVVLQNIALALIVKAVFLALGALGVATMWEAVIADMGTSLLAVLNATRTLRFSHRKSAAAE